MHLHTHQELHRDGLRVDMKILEKRCRVETYNNNLLMMRVQVLLVINVGIKRHLKQLTKNLFNQVLFVLEVTVRLNSPLGLAFSWCYCAFLQALRASVPL